MRLHRFIGPYDLSKNKVEITDVQIIKQIKGVLRLGPGDQILLSTGQGEEAEVSINFLSRDRLVGTILNRKVQFDVEKKVHLYLAILKKENFELALQKAVEVGVSEITPLITERTVKTGLNIPRLEKIIKEASEQSGRNVVPTLSPILDFSVSLTLAQNRDEKIIFHLGEKNYVPAKMAKTASIFVGPEGGFTPDEISLAKETGFAAASLGPLTLRGETAAIVATYRAVQAI